VKFLYADSLDFVDPDFDFETERSGKGRVVHMHDEYPHEYLRTAPYDGLLVSRGIVGDSRWPGKYSEQQRHRFRREGARNFLRYQAHRFPNSIVMGDCGAFSYHAEERPPYGAADTVEFYADGGFTHGCSIDHVIFDFDAGAGRARRQVSDDVRDRYDITLQLASAFLKESKRLGPSFTPLGVVQGWSGASMAAAAKQLVKMGYRYLAVGGLVPLKIEQIRFALTSIRGSIPPNIKLHLLGFGKLEELHGLEDLGVASFDTTSPMLRAFKDAKKNYFARDKNGNLSYYTAIRVPQATLNTKLKRMAQEGTLNQERIRSLEDAALESLRGYAKKRMSLDRTLTAVCAYWEALTWEETPERRRSVLKVQRDVYGRTLADRCWEKCGCAACRESGIDVVIFRSSNRNKRRGIHNLHVFYEHLKEHRRNGNEERAYLRRTVAKAKPNGSGLYVRRDGAGRRKDRDDRAGESAGLRRT
jgi:hypothetical protein